MKNKVPYIVVTLVPAMLLLLLGLSSKGTVERLPTIATSSSSSVIIRTTPHSVQPLPIHTVGEITWHAKDYLGKDVRVQGYLLKKGTGYDIISDEMTGSPTYHDLSVMGTEIVRMRLMQKYILEGMFVANASSSTSRTLYVLEVSKISE